MSDTNNLYDRIEHLAILPNVKIGVPVSPEQNVVEHANIQYRDPEAPHLNIGTCVFNPDTVYCREYPVIGISSPKGDLYILVKLKQRENPPIVWTIPIENLVGYDPIQQ